MQISTDRLISNNCCNINFSRISLHHWINCRTFTFSSNSSFVKSFSIDETIRRIFFVKNNNLSYFSLSRTIICHIFLVNKNYVIQLLFRTIIVFEFYHFSIIIFYFFDCNSFSFCNQCLLTIVFLLLFDKSFVQSL